MDIRPEEIESIKTIGNLNGDDVKLIKLAGGFHVAVGKKDKNSKRPEALAAGSHQGIVAFQVEKAFKGQFQPAMFKSLEQQLPSVKDYSLLLPKELVFSGFELHFVKKSSDVEFIMTKRGMVVFGYSGMVNGDSMQLMKRDENTSIKPNKVISEVFAEVFESMMKEHKISKDKLEVS